MENSDFDALGRPKHLEAARNMIDSISEELGHITERVEAAIENKNNDPFLQDFFRRITNQLKQRIGAHAKHAASGLYTSRAQVIYELLQNADDANYGSGESAEVSFWLTPTSLIFESNELGFTRNNVSAICDTGKSSKAQEMDSTGEKGLGFKSVFAIADRVHVESGHWSFRFDHSKGDDAISMVTPIWTKPSLEPGRSRTRFTLRLLGPEDTASFLLDHFKKLEPTTIFALRQIKRIKVQVEAVDGQSGILTIMRNKELASASNMKIDLINQGLGEAPSSRSMRFRVFHATVNDLPASELRTMTKSIVSVAFPVERDGSHQKLTIEKNIFATLPLQAMRQFPFLVQANFLVNSARDAVIDEPWNLALRKGVVEAFSEAMIRFSRPCDSLHLHWVRYFPATGQGYSGIWNGLDESLVSILNQQTLISTTKGKARKMLELRRLDDGFIDHNKPLLDDFCDSYVSLKYSEDDLSIFIDLGLQWLEDEDKLKAIEWDLSMQEKGRIQSTSLTDSWQERFFDLLEHLYFKAVAEGRIEALELVPLSDNSWTTISRLQDEDIFLPTTDDSQGRPFDIPLHLGYTTLHPDACGLSTSLDFWISCGAKECEASTLVRDIIDHYDLAWNPRSLEHSIADLEAIFWLASAHDRLDLSRIRVFSKSDHVLLSSLLFFPSKEPYHAERLLENSDLATRTDIGILHERYLRPKVPIIAHNGLKWSEFLEKSLGIQYFPPLTQKSGEDVSTALSLVAQDNPGMLVMTLKTHWAEYKQVSSALVMEDLDWYKVPCQNDNTERLCHTILPSFELLEEAKRLGIEQGLPFLALPTDVQIEIGDTWNFLKECGVVCKLDPSFYTRVLYDVKYSEKEIQASQYAMIYEGIEKYARQVDHQPLKEQFEDETLIYTLEAPTPFDSEWALPNECRWDGPEFLSSKRVLARVYGKNDGARRFFCKVLGVENTKCGDVLDHILSLSKSSSTSVVGIEKVYGYLYTNFKSERDLQQIRETFGAHELIYADCQWHSPSVCYWNFTIQILNSVVLSQKYPKLRPFFAETLGIKDMDAKAFVEILKRPEDEFPKNFDEIKAVFLELARLVARGDASAKDVKLLRDKTLKYIPVRSCDGPKLYSLTDHFCVNDHERYARLFSASRLPILDFDIDEMNILYTLLQALGVNSKDRYLSQVVETSTSYEGDVSNVILTDRLRQRAYAFSSCAISRNSRKYANRQNSVHRSMLNIEVFSCEKMTTELSIEHDYLDDDGEIVSEISVVANKPVVQIECLENKYCIYVPKDRQGLSSCFRTELPYELTKILGIEDDAGALKIIYRLLNDDSQTLEDVMQDEDLKCYDWIERAPPSNSLSTTSLVSKSGFDSPTQIRSMIVESQDLVNSVVSEVPGQRDSFSALTANEADDKPPTTPGTQTVSSSPVMELFSKTPSSTATPHTSKNVTLPLIERGTKAAPSSLWREYLEAVTRQAEEIAASESMANLVSLTSAVAGLVVSDTPAPGLGAEKYSIDYDLCKREFGGEYHGRFEVNNKTGLAGELFVYTFLKANAIPGFTMANWQSNLCTLLNVLPGFAGESFSQVNETTDLEYTGHADALLLALKPFIIPECRHWIHQYGRASEPVDCRIEVKTTSAPNCATAFLMSGRQHKFMQEVSANPQSTRKPNTLYVLARVYNVFSAQISLKVAINPAYGCETVLGFEAERWRGTLKDVKGLPPTNDHPSAGKGRSPKPVRVRIPDA